MHSFIVHLADKLTSIDVSENTVRRSTLFLANKYIISMKFKYGGVFFFLLVTNEPYQIPSVFPAYQFCTYFFVGSVILIVSLLNFFY